MQHTFYAVFDNASAAASAIAELERLDAERNHCSVERVRDEPPTGSGTKESPIVVHTSQIVHRGQLLSGAELREGESSFRFGNVIGALAGAALGALAGAIIGGSVAGAAAVPALLGGLLGLVYGGLMGGISAAQGPERELEKIARKLRADEVIVTVAAPALTLEEDGESIVARHGGRILHPSLV